MLLGVPAGFTCYVLHEAVLHPLLGGMLWGHPLITVPAVLGSGMAAGLVRLGGISLLQDSFVLRGWIVACACIIYLVTDRRTEPLTR